MPPLPLTYTTRILLRFTSPASPRPERSTMSDTITVFVSYAWTSTEYRERVIHFAKTLVQDYRIDVCIDAWDLKPGQDSLKFMESMVTSDKIDHVLILCNPTYASKSNNRSGGVGTEAQIITPQLYASTSQTKFIPVIFERDANGVPSIPAYLKARLYIDITPGNPGGIEELARHIHGQPLHIKPALGKAPSFSNSKNANSPLTRLSPTSAAKLSPASRKILTEQKLGYELFFLCQQLEEAISQRTELRDRARHGIIESVRNITAEELVVAIPPTLAKLQAISRSGEGLFNGMFNEALAGPGIPANLEKIITCAHVYGTQYEKSLEYKIEAASLDSHNPHLSSALQVLSRFADHIISEFESLPERLKNVLPSNLEEIETDENSPVRHEQIEFTLEIPPGLYDKFREHIEHLATDLNLQLDL